MKKFPYLLTSIVVVFSLLAPTYPTYSADYDDCEDKPHRVSMCSIFKTTLVGAALLTSPAAVMAEPSQPSNFVGSYGGTLQTIAPQFSSNLNISNMYPSNWNNYQSEGSSSPYYISFYENSNNPLASFLNIQIECVQESHCNKFYMKTINFCRKIFDVNYYADLIYDPRSSGSYLAFALSVWDSLPALNTTAFEETFKYYMSNKNSCPANSTY